MVQLLSYCKAVLTENQRINMHLHSLGVAAPTLETLNNPLPAALTASLGSFCEGQGNSTFPIGSTGMATGAAMPNGVDAGTLGPHVGVRAIEASWCSSHLRGCCRGACSHTAAWRPCRVLHSSNMAAADVHPHRCCFAWSPVLCLQHCVLNEAPISLSMSARRCRLRRHFVQLGSLHLPLAPAYAVQSIHAEPVCCVPNRPST